MSLGAISLWAQAISLGGTSDIACGTNGRSRQTSDRTTAIGLLDFISKIALTRGSHSRWRTTPPIGYINKPTRSEIHSRFIFAFNVSFLTLLHSVNQPSYYFFDIFKHSSEFLEMNLEMDSVRKNFLRRPLHTEGTNTIDFLVYSITYFHIVFRTLHAGDVMFNLHQSFTILFLLSFKNYNARCIISL